MLLPGIWCLRYGRSVVTIMRGGERRISSTVLSESWLSGGGPESVTYVEVPVVEKVVREVPRLEIVEVEKRVPKIEVKYVDKIVEVPSTRYVDKLVHVRSSTHLFASTHLLIHTPC